MYKRQTYIFENGKACLNTGFPVQGQVWGTLSSKFGRTACRVLRVMRWFSFHPPEKQATGPNSLGATLNLRTRVRTPASAFFFPFCFRLPFPHPHLFYTCRCFFAQVLYPRYLFMYLVRKCTARDTSCLPCPGVDRFDKYYKLRGK